MGAGMTEGSSSGAVAVSDARVPAFALLLFVDFIVAVVMLATDKNLQTDFGAQAPYYAHWYGVLGIAVINLLLAVLLFASGPLTSRGTLSASARKKLVVGGLGWTILAILGMVGVVATYSQVGFSSVNQFAQYLFGTTAYPDTLSYIPWLYDAMLLLFVISAAIGILAVMRVRSVGPGAASS